MSMGKLKGELSQRNSYWIDRHRYYELKHFCLQYPLWRKAYLSIDCLSRKISTLEMTRSTEISNPTAKYAEMMAYYSERMELVQRIATETDASLSIYIFKAVTEGLSYDGLKAKLNIPCCRDTYYGLYRKFFWLLMLWNFRINQPTK